jgi:hypothetical protein
MIISSNLIPIVSIVAGTAIIMSVLRMINDQLLSRSRQRPPELDAEITRRLERIEHIVDSTAVEVERIAEGNRFVSKLLAERSESINKS